jgi:pimeloyl-ACP methyl ester carboxylesterase
MPYFSCGGIDIAFVDEGEGQPILLIHGFGSDVGKCWRSTGWMDVLTGAGRRVIAFDLRGHGQSAKPYDPSLYSAKIISEDAAALLDHLSIESADIIGYSMGALIAAFLAVFHPGKVRSVVFGGLGTTLKDGIGDSWDKVIRTFHSSGRANLSELERQYHFESVRNRDVEALAACMNVLRETLPSAHLERVQAPVLIAVGDKDEFAGSAGGLANLLPTSDVLTIPGFDHMGAIASTLFQRGVVEFLRRVGSSLSQRKHELDAAIPSAEPGAYGAVAT